MSTDPEDALEEIIEFFERIDALKRVLRQSSLIPRDGEETRRENVAEHSWHVAMLALLMEERLEREGLDVGRIIRMLLVHDLAEIISGDMDPFKSRKSTMDAVEASASEKLLKLAPAGVGRQLEELWSEFRQKETPEAIRAHSIDRAHPVLMNIANGGDVWIRKGVPAERVRRQMIGFILKADPGLHAYLTARLDDAERNGFFPVTDRLE